MVGTVAGGGGGSLLSLLGNLFFQWLGVTRASNPPVTCGHIVTGFLSFVLFQHSRYLDQKGCLATLLQKKTPNVFLSVR